MKEGITILAFTTAWMLLGFLGSFVARASEIETAAAEEIQDLLAASLEKNEVAFIFLGYSGIILRAGDQIILIDPANLLSTENLEILKKEGVDLLLFTHGHGDHLNLQEAQKIFEGSQPFVACDPSLVDRLGRAIPSEKLTGTEPGKFYNLGKISLEAAAGKHIGSITLFKVTVGDIRIFHGGDSADVPLGDYPSDIAFLPTGDPSPTASPENALKMASDLKPQVVVTMHGSDKQNKEFKDKMNTRFPQTKVIIPEKGKVVKVTLKTKQMI